MLLGWPLQRVCKAVRATLVRLDEVLHPPSFLYRYKLAANTIPRLIFSIAASKCSASSMLPTCNQGCPQCQGSVNISHPTMAVAFVTQNRAWNVRCGRNAAQPHHG